MLKESILQYIVLPTFIKLPFVFKTFVLSIFEWPLKTRFTVQGNGYSIDLPHDYELPGALAA